METPGARIQAATCFLLPVEDLLVGRIFAARKWTGFNSEDDECAKKLMGAVLAGGLPFDWEVARAVAASSKYRCETELKIVRQEVEEKMAESNKRSYLNPDSRDD